MMNEDVQNQKLDVTTSTASTPDKVILDDQEWAEKLKNQVKQNSNQLTLEAKLLQAKKYFKPKSKSVLIKRIKELSLTKLSKQQLDGLRNLNKSDLSAKVIKLWLVKEQSVITDTKQQLEVIESNPELATMITEALKDVPVEGTLDVESN
jgi:hypothetical protein